MDDATRRAVLADRRQTQEVSVLLQRALDKLTERFAGSTTTNFLAPIRQLPQLPTPAPKHKLTQPNCGRTAEAI